jgi:hypothetical protein
MGKLADIDAPRAEPSPVTPLPVTLAGLYVCQRFRIRPVIADLVASLADLGPDRRPA